MKIDIFDCSENGASYHLGTVKTKGKITLAGARRVIQQAWQEFPAWYEEQGTPGDFMLYLLTHYRRDFAEIKSDDIVVLH
jgi:hypothetical protein